MAHSLEIPAYFSHSYRSADRELNLYFWRLFSEANFFFSVDPQSAFFSVPYLESMMRRSGCFVAVVPVRKDQPATRCSPYMTFEFGLALQAQKPFLVFYEDGVGTEAFPIGHECVIPFKRNPNRLENSRKEFSRMIEDLADKVRGYVNPDVRPRLPIAIVSVTGVSQVFPAAVVEALQVQVETLGFRAEEVVLKSSTSFDLCLQLERYDLLILDTKVSEAAPWLSGFAFGRLIPTIRTCFLDSASSAKSVNLPSLLARYAPQPSEENPVIFWNDPGELVSSVARHLRKLDMDRTEFHTLDEGTRYFKGAGRRPEHIFISNASDIQPLAMELVADLRLDSLDVFHYKIEGAIPVGSDWREQLREEIEKSTLFVCLVSPGYELSEWCRYELDIAAKLARANRAVIYPYLVTEGAKRLDQIGEIQFVQLGGQSNSEIVKRISNDIDHFLTHATALGKKPPANSPKSLVAPSPRFTEQERTTIIGALAEHISSVDDIKRILIHALLWDTFRGKDFSGGPEQSAQRLVTIVEDFGLLPGGESALVQLLRSLPNKTLGNQWADPIEAIVQRLQSQQ